METRQYDPTSQLNLKKQYSPIKALLIAYNLFKFIKWGLSNYKKILTEVLTVVAMNSPVVAYMAQVAQMLVSQPNPKAETSK